VAAVDVPVTEVGEDLVQLRDLRGVVGDVPVCGDGRAVVALEEVAELGASGEPVDVADLPRGGQ
jgi:hypothetical protein